MTATTVTIQKVDIAEITIIHYHAKNKQNQKISDKVITETYKTT